MNFVNEMEISLYLLYFAKLSYSGLIGSYFTFRNKFPEFKE